MQPLVYFEYEVSSMQVDDSYFSLTFNIISGETLAMNPSSQCQCPCATHD